MLMMIRGIKSSLVKLILVQINFVYIVKYRLLLLRNRMLSNNSSVYVPILLRLNINFYQSHDNF